MDDDDLGGLSWGQQPEWDVVSSNPNYTYADEYDKGYGGGTQDTISAGGEELYPGWTGTGMTGFINALNRAGGAQRLLGQGLNLATSRGGLAAIMALLSALDRQRASGGGTRLAYQGPRQYTRTMDKGIARYAANGGLMQAYASGGTTSTKFSAWETETPLWLRNALGYALETGTPIAHGGVIATAEEVEKWALDTKRLTPKDVESIKIERGITAPSFGISNNVALSESESAKLAPLDEYLNHLAAKDPATAKEQFSRAIQRSYTAPSIDLAGVKEISAPELEKYVTAKNILTNEEIAALAPPPPPPPPGLDYDKNAVGWDEYFTPEGEYRRFTAAGTPILPMRFGELGSYSGQMISPYAIPSHILGFEPDKPGYTARWEAENPTAAPLPRPVVSPPPAPLTTAAPASPPATAAPPSPPATAAPASPPATATPADMQALLGLLGGGAGGGASPVYQGPAQVQRSIAQSVYGPVARYRFAEGGHVQMEDGGFVMTKKAVDGAGGPRGIQQLVPGARPIRGPGTGTSDSIPATIQGRNGATPAKVSNGEAYVPRAAVQQAGGPQRMYALMNSLQRKA